MKSIIGKPYVVRAKVAGVHCGIVEEFDPATQTVKLKDARRLWKYYTRDRSGSVSDVAANPPRTDADHMLGAALSSVVINSPEGLELAEMTPAAYEGFMAYENK